MKKIFKIFTMCVPLVLAGTCIWAQDAAGESETVQTQTARSQKVSVSADFLRTDINVEYSPNQFFDFGLGYKPGLLFLPASEGHVFARACFFDFPVQPYVQLSASFTAPYEDYTLFYADGGAGVKVRYGEHFYCGAGGSYTFIGKNRFSADTNGFWFSVFAGYSFLNF